MTEDEKVDLIKKIKDKSVTVLGDEVVSMSNIVNIVLDFGEKNITKTITKR